MACAYSLLRGAASRNDCAKGALREARLHMTILDHKIYLDECGQIHTCVAHCGRAKSKPNVLLRADDYIEDNLTMNTMQPLKSETDLYLMTWEDAQNIQFGGEGEKKL